MRAGRNHTHYSSLEEVKNQYHMYGEFQAPNDQHVCCSGRCCPDARKNYLTAVFRPYLLLYPLFLVSISTFSQQPIQLPSIN